MIVRVLCLEIGRTVISSHDHCTCELCDRLRQLGLEEKMLLASSACVQCCFLCSHSYCPVAISRKEQRIVCPHMHADAKRRKFRFIFKSQVRCCPTFLFLTVQKLDTA